MKVQGACHCGQITYEADVDPERVGICHGTDCQILTGSAFRVSVQAPAETYRLLSGQPKLELKGDAPAAMKKLRAVVFVGGCSRFESDTTPRRRDGAFGRFGRPTLARDGTRST